METLTVRPKDNKQLMAVTAILKALDVAFNKGKESPFEGIRQPGALNTIMRAIGQCA